MDYLIRLIVWWIIKGLLLRIWRICWVGKKFGKRWWRSVRSSLRSKDELGETEIVPWREGEIRRRQCGGVTMTRTRSPRLVERQGWRKGFRVYISYFISRFHVYRFHAVFFWSSSISIVFNALSFYWAIQQLSTPRVSQRKSPTLEFVVHRCIK